MTDQLLPSVLLTVLNVPLMLVASLPTIPTKATMIKPINTAYSTAVGPSSLVKKLRTFEIIAFIANSLSKELREAWSVPIVNVVDLGEEGHGAAGLSYSCGVSHLAAVPCHQVHCKPRSGLKSLSKK
jgi:hypothetical protein